MKKILLGTTAAIAMGTLSTEAFAADKIKLELGGFMRQYVGFSNSDEVAATANTIADRDTGIGQQGNTEIYFTGSTTLDNGLKVSVTMEMEANREATTNMDESYLTVSSNEMGALTMGADVHAGDDMAVRAPIAGNHDWGDLVDWVGSATTAGGNSTATTDTAGDITDWGDDTIKVKYMSPSFAGVTVGASWSAAEGNNIEDGQLITNNRRDGYTMGIAYAGDFDGIGVDASLIHGRVSATHDQTHLGLAVNVAGVTVGGSYMDFDGVPTTGANTDSTDGKAWELGVGYETGPYSLSATYVNSENKGTSTAGDNEDTKWQINATYDMGSGVALTAAYFDQSQDAEGATASVDTNGLIAGIEVSF